MTERAARNGGPVLYEALRVGERRRRLFILDRVLDDTAARRVHRHFADLPMTLSDSDRPDTAHVRHLKHEFDPTEWESDPVLSLLTQRARRFLRERRIACGKVYRIYANFNLYGDFQFAHEDGEGWTALAFINSRWEEDWGGELIIYPDASASYAYCVAPRPGRMVMFDGMIRHRGGAPSKHCLEPRISLAIKFRPANLSPT
jgi:Rps23 Pro-64 3,4-dihydroxylase Tpa1-like proline 4-hydroxylase